MIPLLLQPLDHALRRVAEQHFPEVAWALPPLSLSLDGEAALAAFPPTSLCNTSGKLLLADIKLPERNLEWPATAVARCALWLCGKGHSYADFTACGGLEGVVWRCGWTVLERVVVARGIGIVMLCLPSR